MEIGWIGTGKLGLAMAAKAVAAGHDVAAYVRDPAKADGVAAKGVSVRVFEDVAQREVVVTCLPDDAALEAVSEPLFETMSAGSLLVETSTVSVAISRSLALRAEKSGVAYLRAPISGNPPVITAGKATILASGPKESFEAASALFDSFAVAKYWLGETEQARVVKLAVNLMVAQTCTMIGEGLALAISAGIERDAFLDILATTALASPFVQGKAAALKKDDMSPTFTGAQIVKDLGLALTEATLAGVPLPQTAVAMTQFAALRATAEQDQDLIAVAKLASRFFKPD
jgi:3-hydroxyisobutyrate dehydrogenase-like beta-hydroxyacid dehydrogenase